MSVPRRIEPGDIVVLRLRYTGDETVFGRTYMVVESVDRRGRPTGARYHVADDGSLRSILDVAAELSTKLSTRAGST